MNDETDAVGTSPASIDLPPTFSVDLTQVVRELLVVRQAERA
ncbi:hypothetical protein ACO2Q7_09555 [Rathayibacter sp. KR2-224]